MLPTAWNTWLEFEAFLAEETALRTSRVVYSSQKFTVLPNRICSLFASSSKLYRQFKNTKISKEKTEKVSELAKITFYENNFFL